jgi:CIC family chloride channel protein
MYGSGAVAHRAHDLDRDLAARTVFRMERRRSHGRWTRQSTWVLLLLMVATGALAGFAGGGLLSLLGLVERTVWPVGSRLGPAFAEVSPLHRVGALLVAGVITTAVRLMLRHARTQPTELLGTLWEQAGIISLGKTVGRSLLSVVDVGLGAALGREGALKELGGAIASRVALGAGLGLGHRRLLVACGTAAGIAAAYNVPVGGALFGLEILLGRIEIEMVAPMIVCCASATTVSRWLSGNMTTYHVPPFHLGGPIVLAQSLLFGATLGAISALLLKGLRWFETVEEWNARLAPFMPLFALGALGVASAWLPQLLGNGYDVADAALHHRLAVSLLVTLPILRFLATATCRAARVPGGLFTPMLSIGALIGGLIGEGICRVWPATSAGAFAVLGMGGLLAGTSRGPIASVVLVYELSYDYQLILPLVFTCGAAALVSRGLERGSLYRLGPRRRPPPRQQPQQPYITLHPTRKVPALICAADVLPAVLTPDPRPLFVVDERERLRGAFHPETARHRIAAESLPRLLIVGDLIDRDCPRLSVHASRDEARDLFAKDEGLRFVPIVDDEGILVGEACREDFAP